MFIDKNLVKNVINVFNCVKKAHFKSKKLIFGENGHNWVILSSKMTSEVITFRWNENIFTQKSLKNYCSDIFYHNIGQNYH